MAVSKLTVVEESTDVNVTEERFVLNEQVVGIQGPGGDAHFVHDQETPSDEWTITHNLGKNPAVTVVDSGGTEWQTAVEHISENELTVRFSAPFAGRAYLN